MAAVAAAKKQKINNRAKKKSKDKISAQIQLFKLVEKKKFFFRVLILTIYDGTNILFFFSFSFIFDLYKFLDIFRC